MTGQDGTRRALRIGAIVILAGWPGWGAHEARAAEPATESMASSHAVAQVPPPGSGIGQPETVAPTAPPASGPRTSTGRGAILESTPLEDLLLEKGIISMDDWLRIKAEEERKIAERTSELQFISSPRWYERINVNGYAQLRYTMKDNGLVDLPLGESTSTRHSRDFFFRRVRLVFQGQVSERLAFFLQFALEGNGFRLENNELVDMYGDYFLTKDRVHRVRFGLHRVPNAFDTYRSSSQRQELDRAEAVQSGAPGERDIGLAYYWSPKIAQERYARLATYHNGPGDYGVFGIMVYNGQLRSQTELNDNKHLGAKLSYPFELPNGRLLETGVMGFFGQYVVAGSGLISPTATPAASTIGRCTNQLKEGGCPIQENRVTGYIWTPPQPWGFLGEYTIGRGPERNANDLIEEQSLYGGYAQLYYTWRYSDVGMLTPYIRYGYYHGGMKSVRLAAPADNHQWNFGLVWEPDTHLRLVAEYSLHDRLNVVAPAGQAVTQFGQPPLEVAGQMLRFQLQWFWN